MNTLNETHGADLKCWVPSAMSGDTDFPVQNLPFAIFRRAGTNEAFRGGVAIGDQIVDLAAVSAKKIFAGLAQDAVLAGGQSSLNALMALGNTAWTTLRLALSRSLRVAASQQSAMESCLVAQSDAEYALPAHIGDYTDFYTSIFHATNIGKLFRPDSPLMPNYKWVPIGYHGRASSISVSPQQFSRPVGQTMAAGEAVPAVGPCNRLDIELELGIFIGSGNKLGSRIPITQADAHVFGICLLNDWSARDIQAWEYQPLGPFLAKNFATTISPWVVTMEALAPYRTAPVRPADDPAPLPYLDSAQNRLHGALNIELEVSLQTTNMREANMPAEPLARTNYRHAYWTIAQMVAHHTINGCNLQSGDLFGSGTLSGPSLNEAGALIEITQGGKAPITLANGETRTFLEDGDTVVIRGWCQKDGAARVGFGECTGTVLAALDP
jgi:fumarylacetoacetase